jgi:hypothetical protein
MENKVLVRSYCLPIRNEMPNSEALSLIIGRIQEDQSLVTREASARLWRSKHTSIRSLLCKKKWSVIRISLRKPKREKPVRCHGSIKYD